MAEIKYYIGTVNERNGDMEYDTQYLFCTRGSPDNYSEKVTKNWRGGDVYDEEYDGYWSDDTLMSNGGYKEVPKEDFDVLKKYLANL